MQRLHRILAVYYTTLEAFLRYFIVMAYYFFFFIAYQTIAAGINTNGENTINQIPIAISPLPKATRAVNASRSTPSGFQLSPATSNASEALVIVTEIPDIFT